MKVLLVETATAPVGSMRRYADLVEQAFSNDADIQIQRFNAAAEKLTNPILRRLGSLNHHASVWQRSRVIASQTNADVVHIVDGSHGYLADIFRRHPCVVTVHDFIPKLQSLGEFAVSRPSRISRWTISRAVAGLRAANHLIMVSNHTRKDATNLGVGTAATVIAPPLAELGQHAGAPIQRQCSESAEQSPYILHIGNNGFYKNREGVIDIFNLMASQVSHRLLLAGPAPNAAIEQAVAESEFRGRIHFLTDPTDAEIQNLYRNAALFVFPSLYEGFGWPPLEAMQLGCPVVCSDVASLPEVVGDAAIRIDPADTVAFASACIDVLTNNSLHSELIQQGHRRVQDFNLDRFAIQVRKVYAQANEDHRLSQGLL